MRSLSSEEGLESQNYQHKYLTIYIIQLASNIHLGKLLNFTDVIHGDYLTWYHMAC